ncbi:MAG: molybdate ABC transporter substrate-binding protein [Solirubrobacteraceae bacterium]
MRARLLVALGVLVLILAGCGGDEDGADRTQLTVSAASSLKRAFTGYAASFEDARARLQFAGSDELAAQIRRGARPDVYAAANTRLPEELFKAGLVERPRVFAANRLVLAVPAKASEVGSLDELARPGITIAAGAPSVPVGSYTREVIGKLPASEEKAILANIRSNEPDVAGVVGKLTQGAVDAGFVYVTDVMAAAGRLRAIELSQELEPQVAYGVAVVKGAKNPRGARAFVAGLLAGRGLAKLRKAGFEPPPAR